METGPPAAWRLHPSVRSTRSLKIGRWDNLPSRRQWDYGWLPAPHPIQRSFSTLPDPEHGRSPNRS